MRVRCNKCGYVGEETEFPTGRDFFQKKYIANCLRCDNRQNPGDASLRMMPGMDHPFEFVREGPLEIGDARTQALIMTLHNSEEAS